MKVPTMRGIVLLLSLAGAGCTPGPEPVAPSSLPDGAAFADLGSVGRVYRLRDGRARAEFPVSREAAASLLPATLRLFRFDEERSTWTEVAGSRFDERSGRLVAGELAPGYYTGAGWSRNPAANALQRMIVDARNGFGPPRPIPLSRDSLRERVAAASAALRPGLLRDYVVYTAPVEQSLCGMKNLERCPLFCRHIAAHGSARPLPRRTRLSSCPVECPDDDDEDDEDDCCSCEMVKLTEYVLVPEDPFDVTLVPCAPGQGRPCPVCPTGLSCGRSELAPIIGPTVEVPDYDILYGLGMGDLVADTVFRGPLHAAVEASLGTRYPVPPTWP